MACGTQHGSAAASAAACQLRLCSHGSVCMHHGTESERMDAFQTWDSSDVVLTSYGTLLGASIPVAQTKIHLFRFQSCKQ